MRAERRSLLGLAVLVVVLTGACTWWAERQQGLVGRQAAELAQAGDIGKLSSDACAYCRQARTWLQQQGVPFAECSIERDTACRRDYLSSIAPGTPVLLVRQQVLVGFNPQLLLAALQRPV